MRESIGVGLVGLFLGFCLGNAFQCFVRDYSIHVEYHPQVIVK